MLTPLFSLRRRFNFDRHPIAAIHVADKEHTSATNPAGWLYDPTIDAMSDAGKAHLRDQFYEWAQGSVVAMQEMNAQGMVCWEIDGARYGTYLGCPDQAVDINPELTGIVDEFFGVFRKAGFKVGCTIRPVEFAPELYKPGEVEAVVNAPAPDAFSVLLRKARYARSRWKCRIFYVDSNVRGSQPPTVRNEWQWGPLLPASVFARLRLALPDCLFIAEHENEDIYREAAAYAEFSDAAPPPWVKEYLPDAFAVVNCNAALNNGSATPEKMTAMVKTGNILLCDGNAPWLGTKMVGEAWKAGSV